MSTSFRDKHIFVVDDTAFMRAGLINILVNMGFDRQKITQFDSGLSALEGFKSQAKVDLIFSDWNMPLMTGIELLKAIRTSGDSRRDIPIVMITTVSEKDKVIEALKFRLSGYILKPVEQTKVLEIVSGIFEAESDES